MRVCLLQSNYIPWKGYFDLIDASDLCVLYDSRQYTKNDWRNRNQVLVGGQPTWLTIPVATSGRMGQRICDTEVSSGGWARKHWRTIEQAYARRPEFARYSERWAEEWRAAEEERFLSAINERFLRMILGGLGTTTPLARDVDLAEVRDLLDDSDDHPSEVVAKICAALGATEYLTGPAGLGYLREADFTRRDVRVVVADYSGYRPYAQGGTTFTHAVSAIDLLANVGGEARDFLVGRSWRAEPAV